MDTIKLIKWAGIFGGLLFLAEKLADLYIKYWDLIV